MSLILTIMCRSGEWNLRLTQRWKCLLWSSALRHRVIYPEDWGDTFVKRLVTTSALNVEETVLPNGWWPPARLNCVTSQEATVHNHVYFPPRSWSPQCSTFRIPTGGWTCVVCMLISSGRFSPCTYAPRHEDVLGAREIFNFDTGWWRVLGFTFRPPSSSANAASDTMFRMMDGE